MKPKRTILCVDDDERALSIRKVLLETRGYRVIACVDPDRAIEIVKTGGIDLLLVDLMMPKRSGANLIDELKTISPCTPAILFSDVATYCAEDTVADVFLPKGTFGPAVLLERIRTALVRKRGPKPAVARIETTGRAVS